MSNGSETEVDAVVFFGECRTPARESIGLFVKYDLRLLR
jgi:hypothetical protein